MSNEQLRVGNIVDLIKNSETGTKKLKFNPKSKRVYVTSQGDSVRESENEMDVNAEDMTLSADCKADTVIVIAAEQIEAFQEEGRAYELTFSNLDDGDVYVCSPFVPVLEKVQGSLSVVSANIPVTADDFGKPNDQIRVVCRNEIAQQTFVGYVKSDDIWCQVSVMVIPIKSELFSRNKGILETSVVSDKKVAVFGVGSVGSQIVLELARSGIQHIVLIDFDRYEPANVSRNQAGLDALGRYKVKAIADMIRKINPFAVVEVYVMKVGWDNLSAVLQIIDSSDLVYAVPDCREARLVINYACVKKGKKCIFAGAFNRAHGGQVLGYQPGKSLCYQCYVKNVPSLSNDVEIANQVHADRIAYSDRPTPIEPGLSTDIAPISLMAVKLGIQYLLKGQQTTLRSLDDDLVASLYLWLNRREGQFEDLMPLGFNVDRMSILRWYGVDIDSDPECPVCGEFKLDQHVKE